MGEEWKAILVVIWSTQPCVGVSVSFKTGILCERGKMVKRKVKEKEKQRKEARESERVSE